MKRRTFLGFTLALITAAFALLPASALAMEPQTETQQYHRHFDQYADCGTFIVTGDFDVYRTVTTFYDQNGTPIRRVYHLKISGSVTNATTGATLSGYRHGIVIEDLLTGVTTVDGQVVRIGDPGDGTVFLETGRYMRDASNTLIFEAGQQPLEAYADGDPTAVQDLCAALS